MLIRILFIFLLLYFFILPLKADAHLGNGPPFMKINGVYSQTNPLSQQGTSTLTLSWDAAPESYLLNTPVKFDLDVPILLQATTVAPEYAKDIKIRWSVATGDNFENKNTNYAEGTSFTKTFDKPGSYLVIVEAKLPADTDYILINTAQIDVLPDKEYRLPTVSAYIGTHNDDPKKQVLLVSSSTVDPSTKIKKSVWDFGDGQLREGTSIDRRFERVDQVGVETVYHRVIDEKGLITNIAFLASKLDNKLRFDPLIPGTPLPGLVVTYDEAAQQAGKQTGLKLTLPVFFGAALAVLLLTAGGWWWMLKKKK